MTVAPISHSPLLSAEIPEAPKGRFQRLCDWAKEHKREIAIALIIMGIAALTFGLGAIIGILAVAPVTPFSYLYGFFYSLFQFAPSGAIVGLTVNGSLFVSGIGCAMGGTALTCFGKGMLNGLKKED